MNKQLLKYSLGWGIVLGLIVHGLGIMLVIVEFFDYSASVIKWITMPIGILLMLWVLYEKIKLTSLKSYLLIAIVWTLIAITFDYFYISMEVMRRDNYFELSANVYYSLVFILPLFVGWLKNSKKRA